MKKVYSSLQCHMILRKSIRWIAAQEIFVIIIINVENSRAGCLIFLWERETLILWCQIATFI